MFVINRDKKLAIGVDANNGIWMFCGINQGTCSVGNVASKLLSMSRHEEIITLSKTTPFNIKRFIELASKVISQTIKRICPGAKAEYGVIYYLPVTSLFYRKSKLTDDLQKLFHTKEEFDMFTKYFPGSVETMIKNSDSGVISDGIGSLGASLLPLIRRLLTQWLTLS